MNVKDLLRKTDKKTSLILLLSPVILTLYAYRGNRYVLDFSGTAYPGASGVVYEYLMSFLLLFVLPALLVKYSFREKLSSYGIAAGDFSYGIKASVIAMAVLVPVLYAGSQMADMRIARMRP